MTYCKRHSTPHELRMNEECKVEECSICGRIEMKEYTITIKVKENYLDDVIGMIKSNSDYDGGLIESMDWEESK